MLVFVEKITPRLIYTFDFVFKVRGVDYSFCTSKIQFEEAIEVAKLNYSSQDFDCATIKPAKLLLEEEVVEHNLSNESFHNVKCLSFDNIIDPIASVFYILSRFEEYINKKRDLHGRFPFKDSVLCKYNWIEKAVCDRWAIEICTFLGLKTEKNRVTKIIPTFDIDNAYAYLHKDKKRQLLSTLKDMFTFKLNRIKERNNVLKTGIDPYDTFSKIKEIAIKFTSTKIFWLVESDGKNDRNVRINHPKHIELIQDLKSSAEINLHPSYGSISEVKKIQVEKEKLEKVLGRQVNGSRQHFLKLDLSKTYRALIENRFTRDFSMGFAEHSGFRSGTARSHQWFDVLRNEVTELNIHPFVYMDGSLNEYMNLSIEGSKRRILDLYQEVQIYGGDFIFLWHNETIGDYGKWKGWSEVLDYTLTLKNE